MRVNHKNQNGFSGAYTNESMTAIITGLQPSPYDDILAVCGSGDQAFAMLEYGPQIFAVDTNPKQIELARKRAELIRRRKYSDFLEITRYSIIGQVNDREKQNWRNRLFYFSRPGRLGRIRDNIQNIDFGVMDIHHIPASAGVYDKVYLSNSGCTSRKLGTDHRSFTRLCLSEHLRLGGMLYDVNGHGCLDEYYTAGKYLGPVFLVIDEDLTRQTRELEDRNGWDWQPTVYRRIAVSERTGLRSVALDSSHPLRNCGKCEGSHV